MFHKKVFINSSAELSKDYSVIFSPISIPSLPLSPA